MTQHTRLDVRPAYRAKIVGPILAMVVAAVVVLSVASTAANLRNANSEIAQAEAIDIWQLHLQADVEHMPALTVDDPV